MSEVDTPTHRKADPHRVERFQALQRNLHAIYERHGDAHNCSSGTMGTRVNGTTRRLMRYACNIAPDLEAQKMTLPSGIAFICPASIKRGRAPYGSLVNILCPREGQVAADWSTIYLFEKVVEHADMRDREKGILERDWAAKAASGEIDDALLGGLPPADEDLQVGEVQEEVTPAPASEAGLDRLLRDLGTAFLLGIPETEDPGLPRSMQATSQSSEVYDFSPNETKVLIAAIKAGWDVSEIETLITKLPKAPDA